jgi:hypothetical protein
VTEEQHILGCDAMQSGRNVIVFEAAHSLRGSIHFYDATWRHIPDDSSMSYDYNIQLITIKGEF